MGAAWPPRVLTGLKECCFNGRWSGLTGNLFLSNVQEDNDR